MKKLLALLALIAWYIFGIDTEIVRLLLRDFYIWDWNINSYFIECIIVDKLFSKFKHETYHKSAYSANFDVWEKEYISTNFGKYYHWTTLKNLQVKNFLIKISYNHNWDEKNCFCLVTISFIVR